MARFGRSFPIDAHINYQGRTGIYFNRSLSSILTESITDTDTILKTGSKVFLENETHSATMLKQPNKNLVENETHLDTLENNQVKIVTGQYTGNGSTKSITGIGFQPDVVLVTPTVNSGAAGLVGFSSLGTPPNVSGGYTGGLVLSNGITSLDSDGFSLGSNIAGNKNGVLYDYIAIYAPTAQKSSGTYVGTGSQPIVVTSGLSFQPDIIFVRDATGTGALSIKSGSMPTNKTVLIGAFGLQGYITIQSAGFTIVSTNANINRAGDTYGYIALKLGSIAQSGVYAGTGVSQSVTGLPWSPKAVMVFSDTTANKVMRTDKPTGDNTDSLASSIGYISNAITSIDANGFTVGTDATVNTNAINNYWIAFHGISSQRFYTYSEAQATVDTFLRTISKNLLDSITSTDTFIRSLVRIFIESFTNTDTFLGQHLRFINLSDSQATIDTILKTTNVLLTEAQSTVDTFIRSLSKTMSESFTSTDTFLKTTSRLFSENVTHIDKVIKTMSRNLTESVTNSDTVNLIDQRFKTLVESFTSTDTFAHVTTFIVTFFESLHFADILQLLKNGLSALWNNKYKKQNNSYNEKYTKKENDWNNKYH